MFKLMKKAGWITGIFLSVALLSGCGGGGGGGNDLPDQPDSSYIKLQSATIEVNATDNSFSVDVPIVKEQDIKVTLSRFGFYVGGCFVDDTSLNFTPNVLEIPAGATQGMLHVEGQFVSQCTPQSYTLSYHEKSEYSGKTKEGDFSLSAAFTNSGTGGGVTPGNPGQYQIFVTPDQFRVAQAGARQAISVQLAVYDDNGHLLPAADQNVSVEIFNNIYGQVTPTRAVTDANGRISFNYEAPQHPENYYGQQVQFDIYMTDHADVAHPVTLIFAANDTPEVNTNGMELVAVPEQVAVSAPGETRALTLYLNNNNTHRPVSGVTIAARVFNQNNGTLNTYMAVTDDNGQVVFNYTAPDQLPNNPLTITFEVDNGNPALTRDVTINFSGSTPIDTTNLRLYAVPEAFSIASGGESRAIDLYVENNETNQPAPGISLIAKFFDPALGTLNTYSGTTDANGHVVFNYTAPETLPGSELNITFEIPNGSVERSKQVTVYFQGATPVDTQGMTLWAVPTELNVTAPDTTHDIKIYLYGENQPVGGQTIIAHVFDPNSGTLNRYSATTDSNGQALFSYLSPAQLNAADFNITFEVLNGSPALDTNVTVRFDHASYSIVPDRNLTVSRADTSYSIEVALYKDTGNGPEPAVGKTVVAEFLMPIYGKMSSYEVVVGSDGVAVFDYQSPGTISDLNDTNITFYYKENRQVLGRTRLSFQPESVERVERLYVVPSSITVTNGGEEHNITIITVNSENIGISTEVTIEQPTTGDGDYGEFIPGGPVTTDSSGRAVVTYRAPDSITGLNERNITFTAKVDDSSNLSTELNIIYSEGTGPGVDYEITVTTGDTLEVNMSGQLTVTIHKRGDLSSPIDNDDVMDVNVTTLFPQMLDFDGNTTFRYDHAGIKAISLRTHTLAGTAVISVDALVYNGAENVRIHREYPVVIMSGPVTAMSIFYVKSEQDEDTGVFRNHYTIHAVDKYDNPARPGIALHPSVINGVKVIRSRSLMATGTLKAADPATFEDTTADYSSVEIGQDGDVLIVVPNADRYDRFYTGTWSISDVLSTTELQLSDPFGPSDVDNLTYLVGGSKRYVSEYGTATVDIESDSGQYLTDENGNVKFIVNFDPVLAGHTVTIGAVAQDGGERTGVAKIESLRWSHYTSTTALVPNDFNTTHEVTLSLGIANINDEPLEHLINVGIPYVAIETDTAQCAVLVNQPGDNMYTDSNGRITFHVLSKGTDPDVKECSITWNKSNGGIYLEY
jgi:hypothetical protein